MKFLLSLFAIAIAADNEVPPKQYILDMSKAAENRWDDIPIEWLDYANKTIGSLLRTYVNNQDSKQTPGYSTPEEMEQQMTDLLPIFSEEEQQEMRSLGKGINIGRVVFAHLFNEMIMAPACTNVIHKQLDGTVVLGRNFDYFARGQGQPADYPLYPLIMNV